MNLLHESIEQLREWSGRSIVAAMSGGVDSSLTAALLHLAGARVIGLNMRVWHYNNCSEEQGESTCCSPSDIADARRVADQFGFPFYSMDFQVNFRESVIQPFIDDYLAGRTPNPCVHCNNQLKLGTLLDKARAYGAESVATGHYARVRQNAATGRVELQTSADTAKDQTYYLFGLTQPQLRRLVLPLGELTKPQAREMAKKLGLHTHDKADSVDICFVPDNDYRRFLREEADLDEEKLAGTIVNTKGEKLGRHSGIHNYTIGQRKGLGIAAVKPLYVVDLFPETQTVVVGFEEDIFAAGLEVRDINWVGLAAQHQPFRATVKIRYRSPGEPATIYPSSERPGHARILFDAPVRAVTPGQAAVAYDEGGEIVLAGGWITRRIVQDEQVVEIPLNT